MELSNADFLDLQLNTGSAAYHNESHTCETGASEKKSSLCGCQPPEQTGDSHPRAPLPLSVQAEVFYKEGEGKQNKEIKGQGVGEVESSPLRALHASQHSLFR